MKPLNEAGKTMNEIVTSIKYVAEIMSEITAASQEQSAGIEQINQAITQMDEVTQQNAATLQLHQSQKKSRSRRNNPIPEAADQQDPIQHNPIHKKVVNSNKDRNRF